MMISLRQHVTGAFLLLLSHQAATTLACSCVGPITIESSLAASETAVFATITEKLTPPPDQFSPQYYRAKADGVLKGCGLTADREFYIKTGANSALCGVDNLDANVRYILFGRVTNEPVVGFVRANVPVLNIDLCAAHSALSSVAGATLTSLYNQEDPVCRPVTVPAPAPVYVPRPVSAPAPRPTTCRVTCATGYTCSSDGYQCIGSYPVPPAPAPKPYPVPVPAPRPYPVPAPVPRTYPYPAPAPRPYPVPVPAPRPYPVPVPAPRPYPVPVPAPRPYPVPAPRPNPVPAPTSSRVSCRTCPAGYFDGCNTCSCDRYGRTYCTAMSCRTYGRPSCSNPPRPVPVPVPVPRPNPVPAPTYNVNCRTCPAGYFDGCNTCTCDRYGRSYCTEIACRRYGQPSCSNPPRPVPVPAPRPYPVPAPRPIAPTPPAINCRSCPYGFYDGCNNCSCESGRSFCTYRACYRYDTPRCNAPPPPPPTNPAPSPTRATEISCRTCPNGFDDGCNNCGCSTDGATFCTQRYCFTRGTPKCNPSAATTAAASLVEEDSTTSVDCRVCPNGYFDGCNDCACGANDVAGSCTKRACPDGNISPPQCK
jgi:hypothetical protein